MKLINLTPHEIKLPLGEGIPPTGYIARVSSVQQQVGEVNGIPILVSKLGSTVNLPDPQDGVAFIVPAVVRTHSPDRKDLLSPTKLIRDTHGRVVGCGAFEQNA